MAQVRFASIDGQEFTVPERVTGESGPQVEITICETGEFIDPNVEPLAFMQQPEPPAIERLEVGFGQTAPSEVDMGDVWHPTADELAMARDKNATFKDVVEMSGIPGVSQERLTEVVRKVWG